MSKLTVSPPQKECLSEALRYNPNCPCLEECSTHGFCSVCMEHHDRCSDHPPLCMRTETLREDQRRMHWKPKEP